MTAAKVDFAPFNVHSGRAVANLETAYQQLLEHERDLAALPCSMYWQHKSGKDYLAIKKESSSNGTTAGARSPETGERFLRTDLRRRDSQAAEFEMAWRRGTRVSLSTIAPSKTHLTAPARPTLLTALRSFDSTFAINRQKPYQTVNDAGFEVTLLAAPSTQPLPVQGAFEPMAALTEQEWLLKGNPVRCIVATKDNHACPLYVPDPRWMAAHKLWLARQSQRETPKKEMGDGQGKVLLDATRYFLRDSYPLDLDFVLELPPELRDLFNEWAESSGFDPTQRD